MKGHAEQCEHLEKRLCCALLLVFIALAMKHGKFEPERGKIKSESATRADVTHSCIPPQAKKKYAKNLLTLVLFLLRLLIANDTQRA